MIVVMQYVMKNDVGLQNEAPMLKYMSSVETEGSSANANETARSRSVDRRGPDRFAEHESLR